MATWTELPQSNIEPEKPIRASDIWAIYQDIKALAEGAEGAPKIQPAALQKVNNLTAGAVVCSANKSAMAYQGMSIKGYSFIIIGNGTLRFNTSLSSITTAGTARWYKNNVAIGSSFTGSNTQDFDVSSGDNFTLQLSVSTSASPQTGSVVSSYLSCSSVSALLPLIAI
jgi:hypothetical protein